MAKMPRILNWCVMENLFSVHTHSQWLANHLLSREVNTIDLKQENGGQDILAAVRSWRIRVPDRSLWLKLPGAIRQGFKETWPS